MVVVIRGMGSVWGALLASLPHRRVLNAFGILVLPRVSIVLIFVVMAVVLIRAAVGPPGPRRERPAPGQAGGQPTSSALDAPSARSSSPRSLVGLVAAPAVLPTFCVWLVVEMLAFALFATSLPSPDGAGGMVSFGHAA